MAAADNVTEALRRDRESKPWKAFVKQNPGIAPLVVAYLDGGPRPTDAQLGDNHYAHARVQTEDARRELVVAEPPPPPTTWKHIATEHESFTLSQQTDVRYGSGTSWIGKTLPAGTYVCDNQLMPGDPLAGTLKVCEVPEGTPTEPPPPPPPPSGLPFALPILTNPIVLGPSDIPSRYNQGTYDNDFMLPEAGRDYLIDLGRDPRHGLVLSSNGRVGNVQIVNGHFACSMSKSGGVSTSFRRGGLRNNIRGSHISITDYYNAGGPSMVDTLTLACRPDTKVTIQRSYLGAYHDLTEGYHADTLQVQGPVGRIEIGLCSLFVAGDRLHAGKGLQLDMIPAQGESAGPFTVELRKVDLNGLGNAATGARSSIAVGKDDNASIAITFAEEVYFTAAPGGFTVQDFPGWNINYPALLQQQTTGTKPNRVQTFPTSAQGWFGTVRERAYGTHFVTPASLGY